VFQSIERFNITSRALALFKCDIDSSHGPIVVGYVDILLCDGATEAIQNGDKVIILSDRATSADRVPVSALLDKG
jgi:glutamate synthase (NADPH/NADH)